MIETTKTKKKKMEVKERNFVKEYAIRLNSIEDVYRFTKAISNINCDFDLISDDRHFVVDAKSVMGVFSLDISKQLTLRSYAETPEVTQQVVETLNQF